MVNLVSRIWECIKAGAEVMHSNDGGLRIDISRAKEKEFTTTFNDIYQNIQKNYMKNNEDSLDRHKVAAITMISVIKSEIVKTENKVDNEMIFLGNYILATDCGFSYMLMELNKKLQKAGEKEIDTFFFPQAMACETDYYRIFYRNLYFANNNNEWGLNALDIAERLFLLEYMTLEKNGIEPSILREY